MKEEVRKIVDGTVKRYAELECVRPYILRAFEILRECFESGGRLYLCGNGGSAADCGHIAGELLKSFKLARPLVGEYSCDLKKYGREGEFLAEKLQGALPAIALCEQTPFSTAFANDAEPELVFAQAVNALGRKGDALLAVSTSGNSANCVYAAIAARAKGMRTVFLGGGDGGRLKTYADVSVIVPELETYKVQELHLPVYHCLCAMLETHFFG